MSDIHLPEFKEREYPDQDQVSFEKSIVRRIFDLEHYLEELRFKLEMVLQDHDAAIWNLESKAEEDDRK